MSRSEKRKAKMQIAVIEIGQLGPLPRTAMDSSEGSPGEEIEKVKGGVGVGTQAEGHLGPIQRGAYKCYKRESCSKWESEYSFTCHGEIVFGSNPNGRAKDHRIRIFMLPMAASFSHAETSFAGNLYSHLYYCKAAKVFMNLPNLCWKMEVDERLLGELEAMGFSTARAKKAIVSSGNSSIEAAVQWLSDHENDTDASETQMAQIDINIGASNSFRTSERVKLKAQGLRVEARRKRADQEKKQEREREKERIRTGKELLEAKRMAEENERRRYLVQRKAEKEEERKARERIRHKLQQDKLERREMLGSPRDEVGPRKPDVALPQPAKNSNPIEPSNLPANTFVVRDQMQECLRSIKRQNKDDCINATRAFQTLLIYVKNIVNDPDERKFRKIRIRNPAFQDRVARYEKGIEFLELCGFEKDKGSQFLLLTDEKLDMNRMRIAWTELVNALTNPFFGLFSV